MKSVKFEGTVEAYQGQNLETPIKFSGDVDQYETVAELKGSEDFPSDSEILKMVNTKKVTAAKASEYQKATADLKKKYENSPEFKKANFIKAAIAGGMSQAQASALADSLPL